MANIALLMLQAASAATASPDDRLLHPVPPATCHASANEITVCGKSADTYRLPNPGVAPGIKGPLEAEWGLFGQAKMDMHGTERKIAPGVSAPAAMVTITVPF